MTTSSPPSPSAASEGLKQSFLSRVLDPLDRFVEAIYSVLIVLTFTLAVRVVDASATSSVTAALSRELFWASLGCAVAWGLIDGVMYILSCMAERGQNLRLVRAIQNAPDETAAVETLSGELDDDLAVVADADDRRALYAGLYRRLKDNPPPREAGFKREDAAGALGIFVVAVAAALPVVLPLLLFDNRVALAVRLSNLIAIGMLFYMGYRWAKYAGGKPLRTGLFLVAIGLAMVVVAIPLGG